VDISVHLSEDSELYLEKALRVAGMEVTFASLRGRERSSADLRQ